MANKPVVCISTNWKWQSSYNAQDTDLSVLDRETLCGKQVYTSTDYYVTFQRSSGEWAEGRPGEKEPTCAVCCLLFLTETEE